jgi:hypothetical protein
VDEERAEVFDDEDGAPGDLGTCCVVSEGLSVFGGVLEAYQGP